MKLQLVRHLWGVDHTHGLDQYLPRWREAGYEALEASIRLVPDRAGFLRFLKESGFQWVPQIFSRDFLPGGSVREHLDSLRVQMEECLDHHPLFFNAHSGYDHWSPAEAEGFLRPGVGLGKNNRRPGFARNPPSPLLRHSLADAAHPGKISRIARDLRFQPLGVRLRTVIARFG